MKRYLRGSALAFVAVFGFYKVCAWFAAGALGLWPMALTDALGLFFLMFCVTLTFLIAMEDFQ